LALTEALWNCSGGTKLKKSRRRLDACTRLGCPQTAERFIFFATRDRNHLHPEEAAFRDSDSDRYVYTLHPREKGIHTDRRRYTATDTSCARDGSISIAFDFFLISSNSSTAYCSCKGSGKRRRSDGGRDDLGDSRLEMIREKHSRKAVCGRRVREQLQILVSTRVEFHAATGGSPALAVAAAVAAAAAVSGRKGRDDLLARRCHTQTHALPSPSAVRSCFPLCRSLPLFSLPRYSLVTSVKVKLRELQKMREKQVYGAVYMPYIKRVSLTATACPPTHLDARHKRRRVDSIDDGGAGRWWIAALLVRWLVVGWSVGRWGLLWLFGKDVRCRESCV